MHYLVTSSPTLSDSAVTHGKHSLLVMYLVLYYLQVQYNLSIINTIGPCKECSLKEMSIRWRFCVD